VQVWDFAGDGYVHRLILSEGSSSPTNVLPPKLIESNAQHTSSAGFRNRTAPLSADQEEMLVNGKLEAAARHYNQLLAWQLEQNRLLYQARLSRIRESISGGTSISAGGKADGYSTVSQSTPSNTGASSSSTGGAKLAHGGTNWRENLILTLRTERGKVAKQVEGAKERLERTRKEIAVLKELRTSLDANRQEWQKRVDVAAQGLAELKQTYQ
jgi:BRCA1-associated protein